MTAGHMESKWDELASRNAIWLVVALAVAASLTGIVNGFAFDDVRVIVEPTRIHSLSGLWRVFTEPYYLPRYGASLYRPLTSLGFGLQWAIGHGSPLPFHFVNVAMYAAVTAAVYRLSRQILDGRAALVSAVIFAVHPVHVEAVANIVGQAELGAALFVVIAVSKYLNWIRSGSIGARETVLLCLMYAVALMFKEHAVVLPALLIAAEMLPSSNPAPLQQRVIARVPLLIAMAIVAAAFIAVRSIVIGEVAGGGDQAGVFVGHGIGVRFLTMLPVVLHWIRLFVWPASLSADYSSPQIDVETAFQASMLPAVGFLVAVVVIAWSVKKTHPEITYAFSWCAITLLIPSNLIIVTGFVLAERALFLPSVGVSMLLGAGLVTAARHASPPMRKLIVAGAAAMIVAGIARSSFRNPAWKNNETLFRQTVEDAPYSYRSHAMLGELLVAKGKGEGVLELTLAVKLAPKNDYMVRYLTARRLHLSRRQAVAVPFYSEALALNPSNSQIREDLAWCLTDLGRLDDAILVVKNGLRATPDDARLIGFMNYADSVRVAASSKPQVVN